MSSNVSTLSPTWPYERVQDYNGMHGYDEIPRKICDYLLDFPVSTAGYSPPDDNEYPRARFIKYLYYDDTNPLTNTLPTPKEKKQIFYDPEKPTTPDEDKGYRLYPLRYVSQAQTKAQTIVRVYIGRVVPTDVFTAEIGIVFEILSNMTLDTNLKSGMSLTRSVAIEQAIIEACDGVNFGGIGTMYFDRRQHGDCGSHSISDETENVGRRLVMGMTFRGGISNFPRY